MQPFRVRLPGLGRILLRLGIALTSVTVVILARLRSSDDKDLSESEAISIAEGFVLENGYSEVFPPPGARLAPEPIDYHFTSAEKLAPRHDSLERKAVDDYQFDSAWLIYFRYTNHPQNTPVSYRDVQTGRSTLTIHQYIHHPPCR